MAQVVCFRCGYKGEGIVGAPCYVPGCVAILEGIGESHATGVEAMETQAEIVKFQVRMFTIRTLASYGVAVAFAVIGAVLILFAPATREVATNIVAGLFIVFSMGIAGYTRFGLKAPGIAINASGAATHQPDDRSS